MRIGFYHTELDSYGSTYGTRREHWLVIDSISFAKLIDDVDDRSDNCTQVANNDQRDSDSDGYGNMCDGDLNNDGRTNTLDLNLYKLAHRTVRGDPNYNPDADFNGDDRVNTLDLNIYKGLHRKLPGPGALVP